MDDLLREFLTETNESLDTVDVELVRFEQEPNNARILDNIFRLVHTIKGTCGFLALPRLEALAHAAETLMGKFRDGMPVTGEAVSVILASIDRIKEVLNELEKSRQEPQGSDADLIGELQRIVTGADEPTPADQSTPPVQEEGTLVYQVLQRPLRAGEVPLDELERAFRDAPGPHGGSEHFASAPQASPDARGKVERGDGDADEIDRGDGKIASQSIRVNVGSLENLMTMVSELVLTRNQLLEIARRQEESEFKVPLERLSNITAELQEGVMKTRMQPIANAWQKLPRIVRDLAADLGKDIEIEMRGAETELDRQVLEIIRDPLVHMVRNAADHGIETSEERRLAGKPEKGTIRLAAYHEGGHIVIAISDDGRGLSAERIRAKAVALGLASEADIERMSEAQLYKFIFAPGFSTAPKITNISGRGVGMDVVRANIDQIGGTIDVRSVLGSGTSFTVKIPLTLAIVSALIVEAAGQRFAIPQLSVVELVRAQSNSEYRVERIKDTSVLRLRDKLLPLTDLKQLLVLESASERAEKGFIVVIQVGNQTFGIVVDGVFHTEEIVVKPMSTMLRHIAMFSGNTILGDGSVIMIIDPNGVAEAIGTLVTTMADPEIDSGAKAETSETMSFLVFRAGSQEPKAVPLAIVTRLEEIDPRQIEFSNGRPLIQYRNQLMPLVKIDADMRLRTEGSQPLLVFSDAGRSMGLLVDEIVDIVEDKLDIEVASDTPGILGSAVIKGQATEIIDVGHFLPLARADWFRRKDAGFDGFTPNVLLVDDSAFFRNMLAPVLKAAGYEVSSVASGELALSVLKKDHSFDVIVTDIEMPGMDGFELAEALAADQRTASLPIIALSSLASPAMTARGRQVGLRNFVAKFDRHSLVAALKEVTVEWNQAA